MSKTRHGLLHLRPRVYMKLRWCPFQFSRAYRVNLGPPDPRPSKPLPEDASTSVHNPADDQAELSFRWHESVATARNLRGHGPPKVPRSERKGSGRREHKEYQRQARHVQKEMQPQKLRGLLDSLFPAEVAAISVARQPRTIPLQPYQLSVHGNGLQDGSLFHDDDNNSEDLDHLDDLDGEEAIRRQVISRATFAGKKKRPLRYDASSILRLRAAGVHLTQHDFQRIMPMARNLDGWMPALDFKIIRVRDILNLTRTGEYLLVFQDAEQAQNYQKRFIQLHQLAQSWTPTVAAVDAAASNSPDDTANPRGSIEYPKDIGAYSILPRSRPRTRLSAVARTASSTIQSVVDYHGLPVLRKSLRTEFEVLLRTDNFQPTSSQLSKAIMKDGRLRRLPWSVVSSSPNTSNLVRMIEHPRDSNLAETYFDNEASIGGLPRLPNDSGTRRVWRCWVVAFTNQAEARRFACAWHCRDIADLIRRACDQGTIPPGEDVVMQAEVLHEDG